MSDAIEGFRALKEHRKALRARLGVDCPGCIQNHPKRFPSVLLPGQRCRVCKYTDPRPREDQV